MEPSVQYRDIPPADDRIGCLVEGCRRTARRVDPASGREWNEWICGNHWRLLTKLEKRVWARFRRQQRRFGERPRPEAYDRIWSAIKTRVRSAAEHPTI